MSTAATIRTDENAKTDMGRTRKKVKPSATSMPNPFAKYALANQIPSEVKSSTQNEQEFAKAMDARYASMMRGNETEHSLIEV